MAAVSFLALTDVNEVRGALGIDSNDIDDDAMSNLHPEEDLKSDLMSWAPTYTTIMAEGLGATPTADQALKYLKLKIYAKYFVAALFASSGINSILQKKSDGSNEGARFTNVDLNELQEYLKGRADALKEELMLIIDPTLDATYSHFGSAVPNYDPVTNE
jgi:hypothetical protein